MKPKISIIIAIYNVEKYLREALESVVKQRIGLENLEVIMVDDGSNDKSVNIIKEYIKKYENFKAIHLKTPSGSEARPRNVGIEKAVGEYIMFLDGDDLYTENTCEILYKAAKKYDSDIVIGILEMFNSRRSKISHIFKTKLTKEKINIKIEECIELMLAPPSLPTKIFKTEFIRNNKITFPEGMIASDAVIAAETLFIAKKITFIPKVIYKYRIREDNQNKSLTQKITFKFFKDYIESRKMIINIFDKYKLIDYYQIMYLGDLSYLFSKLCKIASSSKEEKLQIFSEIQWFIELSKNIKFKRINHYQRQIIDLIMKKEYDRALKLIISHYRYY